MIPVTLTIQGLYSYRSKQTIDFTQLTAARLFGIFGSVGCGKSTILEAISFALYGETERLNKGDNRNYNMMNLKSSELLIDFEFKTGADVHYRFMVKGKRNGKKFEEVKTLDRTAYKWENNDWTPIEVKSADEILGLNYDNFRRTVIIPQGKFQEFLQLNPKDRTGMLMELFNLNKFELSWKVTAIENRNNAEIQNVTGQLQSIGQVQPEVIEQMEKALAEMEQNLLLKNESLKLKEVANKEYEEIKLLCAKVEAQQNRTTELKKIEAEIQKLEQETVEFERFSLTFKSDFDQFKLLENSKKRTADELDILRKHKKDLVENLALAQANFDKTLLEYNAKDSLLVEAAELLKISDIKKTSEENQKLTEDVKRGQKAADVKIDSEAKTKAEHQTLTLNIETTRKEKPDLAVLSDIKTWFTSNKSLVLALQTSEMRLKAVNQQFMVERQKGTELAAAYGMLAINAEPFSAKAFLAFIEDEKAKAEKALTELNAKALHVELQQKLEEFAGALEDGKPCPLCGSEHHPVIFNLKNISTELQQLKIEQADKKKLVERWLSVEKLLTVIAVNLQNFEKQIAEEQRIKNDCEQRLKLHSATFEWANFSPDNEEQLDADFAKAKDLNLKLDEMELRLKNLAEKLVTDGIDKEKIKNALDRLVQKRNINDSKIELLQSQLIKIKLEDFEAVTQDELKAKSEALNSSYKEIVNRYQQEEKKLSEMKVEEGKLNGTIQAKDENLKNLEAEWTKLSDSITAKLLEAGGLSKLYVEEVLAKQLNVTDAKKKVADYKTDVESTATILLQLETERKGRTYNVQIHLDLKAQLAELNTEITSLNQQIGTNRSELQRLKTDNERYAVLKTQLDALELRAKDITEMKTLFRGSAFVNYISTVYLENLCKAGNERFYKLTRQRLSLELSDDNSFQVRDFMNEGKLRNVKTLSGGQTFQASLSLALALADSIHKVAGDNENFFFLDEGFGTLDKDSLSTVFDTLKSLRKENRIVGLISHVEEMQQEITTFLTIENKDEEGSVVKSSWL